MWLTDLATVARTTGLPVIEVDGWRTRGHDPMTDVRTIICHHTAGPATGNYPSLRAVRDGRSDLPGPLAQLGLARDGTVYVIAAGLCYHAGQSRDPAYTNAHSIGIEAEATGTHPWPTAQMDAYVQLVAVLAAHYRVPVARVLGHKETCAPHGRKADPNFDMNAFRARVAALLTAPIHLPEEAPMIVIRREKGWWYLALGGKLVGLYAGQKIDPKIPRITVDERQWTRLAQAVEVVM